MSTTPIFYTISADYVPFATVALNSLIQATPAGDHYQVIFMHEDLTAADQAFLKGLATDQVAVDCYRIDPAVLDGIAERPGNFLRGDFYTPAIFYRLFIADLFPQYDRALYVDTDTVWAADPAPLVNFDLQGNLIAASRDYSIAHVQPMLDYIQGAVGVATDRYINSGVLVLNLARLRAEKFSQHFLTLANRYEFDCIAPDQDYLNAICAGQIQYLPEEDNAMPHPTPDGEPAVAQPRLVHYNLFEKPWYYQDVQYSDYFWAAANQSPVADQMKEILAKQSTDRRSADQAKLDRLMTKAGQLAKQTPSFKSIQAISGEVRL